MAQPLDRVGDMRRKAIFRLFEDKFKAKTRITVGSATCENAAGADDVYARLKSLMEEHELGDVSLSRVGCAGKCDNEPLVTVFSRDATPCKYVLMDADKAEKVFDSHILKGERVTELMRM